MTCIKPVRIKPIKHEEKKKEEKNIKVEEENSDVKKIKYFWELQERANLVRQMHKFGKHWIKIANHVPNRTSG